ncbi:MAG: putative dehydrogenase [Alphaproteobacteria bacterium]|jgi:predicted dehydrogenase
METLHYHKNLNLLGISDHNKERAKLLADHYDLHVYDSTEELIADPKVSIVVNLTDPHNHYEVSKSALLAGKHVYSEKPLGVDMEQAKELVQLAKENDLLLSSAPCSVLSESAQTLWKAVNDGAIGKPRIIYAELDDNPIYRMKPEGWSNERGVAWPYLGEYEVGCTLEHAGYYLTWIAAIFGPAKSITAFSSCVVPDKTEHPLDPADTPDLAVACITFESGVVARLTCSIIGPYDHRIQIIGDEGVLSANECWHYATPVYLERFSQLTLNARKSRTVRNSSLLKFIFGVGGKKQKLVSPPISQYTDRWNEFKNGKRGFMRSIIKIVSKRELVFMDFFRGVADMATAIENDNKNSLPADFVLHINELTLAMQNAGENGEPYELQSTFEPLQPQQKTLDSKNKYGSDSSNIFTQGIEKIISLLHKH